MKWLGIALVAVALAAAGVYAYIKRLRNQVRVQKAIGNIRAARVKSLEAQLKERHDRERREDEDAAKLALESDAAAAEFLSGSGSSSGSAGGAVSGPTDPPAPAD